MAVKDRDFRKLMDGNSVPAETEESARYVLDQKRKARVQAAVEKVVKILDEHGVMVEAQVVIQGSTFTSQVVFKAKD